ncbi:MAG: hypothetical protein AAFP68_08470 [Pseudomonadota bacterium]
MRSWMTICGLACLAACGSSDTGVVSSAAPEPEVYRTVIEADGVPFEISWDRLNRTQATARIFGVPEDQAIDPTVVIQQATGCRVRGRPERVPSEDTVPAYTAAIDCAPGRKIDDTEAARARELAREIDIAVNVVAADPAPASAPGTPSVPVAHVLFEGSSYAQFTATDMERYCAAAWSTRVAPDGRTEYNPCKQRDAFR